MAKTKEEKTENPYLKAIKFRFGNNLTAIINSVRTHKEVKEKANENWLAEKIAEHRGLDEFAPGTCSGWLKGKHIPRTEDLIALSELLERSIDELLGIATEDHLTSKVANKPVSIIEDAVEYRDKREATVKNTKRTLWIQIRIGHTLEASLNHIYHLLEKEVKVCLLTCDPNDHATLTMIVRRKYYNLPNKELAAKSIAGTINDILTTTKKKQIEKTLKIRVIPFFPSTVIYISDPYTREGRLFAVTANYKKSPYLAPVVTVERKEYAEVFDAYCEQFRLLWKCEQFKKISAPIVLDETLW